MAITTYSELQTAIANWLNRTDLTTYIPDFITLAETRINRDVAKMALVGLEKRVTSTTTSGDAYVTLPTDVQTIKSVKLNTSPVRRLRPMSLDAIEDAYPSTSVSKPYAYAMVGAEIRLAPIPDSAYTIEISYCYTPTVLSASNTSNWFLTDTPDLLLYASLLEAEPFLKNDQRIMTWQSMYDRGLESMDSLNNSQRFSDGMEVAIL